LPRDTARLLKFGNGRKFSSAWPFGSIRFCGAMFPGNETPVVGSFTTYFVPFGSVLCEQSAMRSSAVGMVTQEIGTATPCGQNSWLQKKNSLFFEVLNSRGM